MAANFQAGGLASGLDTNTIIDKLVQLRSQPITLLRKRQGAAKTQISLLGDLASKLEALRSAAKALGDGGVLGAKATSTNTAFTATPGTNAVGGSFRIQVQTLAQAAKARSAAFAAGEVVRGGTLALTVQGAAYSVNLGDGATLEDVAAAIRLSGAPLSAVVLDNGTSRYLSITNRDTGHPLSGTPSDALAIVETSTGTAGRPLGAAVFQAAQNATVTVDGLTFTRTGNVVEGAVPGTSLTLKAQGGAAEDLTQVYDPDATKAKLQTFVDAYNAVIGIVQKQLAPTPDVDRESTLSGEASLRSLQARLQRVGAAAVSTLASVRTLSDLGVKSKRDGSLEIDAAALTAAIGRDPAAVNAVFATATEGVAAQVGALVDAYTRAGDGILVSRKASLDRSVRAMDGRASDLQARLDRYRESLVAQFTAMETTISSLKSSGNYLLQQLNSQSNP
jgi:flagellar hook-associated protein 2